MDKEILNQVNVDVAWELVEEYSKFPRWKPEDVNNSCKLITDKLEKYGIKHTVYEPNLYLSVPFTASVKLNDGSSLHAKPPSYSINCENGVSGELHYVPAHMSRDIENLFDKSQDKEASTPEKVKGKIIITEGFSFPGKILDLEKAGAAGVIAINPGVDIHWGICTSIWGMPEYDNLEIKPNIPVVAVNLESGNKLIDLSKKNEKATIYTKLEEGWYNQKIPEVTIEGNSKSDDFILLHGHYDSWDVGVGDNATGDACMLEIARLLNENKSKLKRNVKIAWWPGHSTGRYAGSTWYADNFGIDLSKNCVAQINCDSPGCRWADTFDHLSVMTEAEDYVHKIINDITGVTPICERPHRAGDYSFNNIGISSFFMLSSTMPEELRKEKNYYAVGGCGGNIAWHTENDIMEIADKPNLERDIKVYASSVIELSTCEYLPFNWLASTKEFRGVLNNYQNKSGSHFDLKPSIQALDNFENKLKKFYDTISQGSAESEKVNSIIKKLARILIPLNYARNPRFTHDPALPIPQIPVLSLCEEFDEIPEKDHGFVKNQLVRGQNRVIDSLNQASVLLE
ncbi:M28 family peptidase [Alphaproteobacteria bacterium]|nr:M28 family peptidase [Alphaproteobacteria bacterium]